MKQLPPKPKPVAIIPPEQQWPMWEALQGQLQGLAERLETLRAQGAGRTSEFRQLEQMLKGIQEKVTAARAKLPAR